MVPSGGQSIFFLSKLYFIYYRSRPHIVLLALFSESQKAHNAVPSDIITDYLLKASITVQSERIKHKKI